MTTPLPGACCLLADTDSAPCEYCKAGRSVKLRGRKARDEDVGARLDAARDHAKAEVSRWLDAAGVGSTAEPKATPKKKRTRRNKQEMAEARARDAERDRTRALLCTPGWLREHDGAQALEIEAILRDSE